ncbi:MAG: DUF4910 domain-containing protein [Vicinamibacteria bacterium]
MKPSTAASCLSALAALAAEAGAERRVPFWPDAVPAAIQAEVDGRAALETVRALGRFHRVHGSPGFSAAAEHVRASAEAAGLREARVLRFPADGETRYAHFRSYLGWTATSAVLEEPGSPARVLARFPESPVALADYSQDADVMAELVDVGRGVSASDYEGKDVRGRLVLASGPLPAAHQAACIERGALGLLSDFPNQTTAWSGDDRDLVRWGHLSPYETRNRFAFMLSKRQADALRARLARGETLMLRARVAARMRPASFEVVSALIPGSDAKAGEIVLTAHLCHQSAGANDNASGSAAILEVARALQAAIERGALPAPRRGIRFLWLPEIAGAQAWLVRHPELASRLVAGIHMDMVGGLLSTTRGTFHLSRSAESLPHVVNDVAGAFFEEVVAASAAHAEHGGDPGAGFVWPPGSREVFLGDLRALELGSDHQVFQAAPFGVPMVYFHDWPDVSIHTNKDLPENLDATKLGRVAYMGAGIAWTLAALPDAEAPRLLALARAGAEQRLVRARLRGELSADARDGALFVREAALTGAAALRSTGALWPSVAAAAEDQARRLEHQAGTPAAPAQEDRRVPARSPEIKGPLSVYYYDHLAATLPTGSGADTAPEGEQDERLAYELLNLVDGRRSVGEIRDVLSGRYAPVTLAAVQRELERLARARVVSFR